MKYVLAAGVVAMSWASEACAQTKRTNWSDFVKTNVTHVAQSDAEQHATKPNPLVVKAMIQIGKSSKPDLSTPSEDIATAYQAFKHRLDSLRSTPQVDSFIVAPDYKVDPSQSFADNVANIIKRTDGLASGRRVLIQTPAGEKWAAAHTMSDEDIVRLERLERKSLKKSQSDVTVQLIKDDARTVTQKRLPAKNRSVVKNKISANYKHVIYNKSRKKSRIRSPQA